MEVVIGIELFGKGSKSDIYVVMFFDYFKTKNKLHFGWGSIK